MDEGRLLRQARQDAMLSQRVLASRAGLSQHALSRYETGARRPRLEVLERLLAVCGKELAAELVPLLHDVDQQLDALAALSVEQRLVKLQLLTASLLRDLAAVDGLLATGGWAAVVHGVPTRDPTGVLLVEPAAVEQLAGVLARRFAHLVVNGEIRSLDVRPGTFARNPVALWNVQLAGRFVTRVVRPGPAWPPEVRVEMGDRRLRVLAPQLLGPAEGLDPRVMAALERRRDGPGLPLPPRATPDADGDGDALRIQAGAF